MTDDLVASANRTAGTFLVIVAAMFTIGAPLFGLTYSQPDMGLLVIIDVVPFLWGAGLIFACLAIGFAARHWQRIAGIILVSVLGAEVIALAVNIAVNILMR